MKKTIDLMQEEAVAEKAVAVQMIWDSFKWMYATGVALNGAGLLKVAEAKALSMWDVIAGLAFACGLAAAIWSAIRGGQLANYATNRADHRIGLLFDIEDGKAGPERLLQVADEDTKHSAKWAKTGRVFLYGSLALFATGLIVATAEKALASQSVECSAGSKGAPPISPAWQHPSAGKH
jgi:hypothetical protein